MKQRFELSHEEMMNALGSHVTQAQGVPGTRYNVKVRVELDHLDRPFAIVTLEPIAALASGDDPPPRKP